MKRAQFWKNIFDPRTGYIAPRKKDGSFIPVDSASRRHYVEGNARRNIVGWCLTTCEGCSTSWVETPKWWRGWISFSPN